MKDLPIILIILFDVTHYLKAFTREVILTRQAQISLQKKRRNKLNIEGIILTVRNRFAMSQKTILRRKQKTRIYFLIVIPKWRNPYRVRSDDIARW